MVSIIEIYGIPVNLYEDLDHVHITDHKINMYGCGRTREKAIEDYKTNVRDYFEELERDEDILGDNLKRHLYYLRDCFNRTPVTECRIPCEERNEPRSTDS